MAQTKQDGREPAVAGMTPGDGNSPAFHAESQDQEATIFGPAPVVGARVVTPADDRMSDF